MRRNAYGGYRGRRTGRDILKLLIALLLILVVVLAGIVFFNRDQLKGPEEPEEPQTEQTVPEQPELEPAPAPEPEPLPEPEPAPEPEPEAMTAVSVSMEQVMNNTWRQALEQAGGNAVVVNMKPDDGTLNWEMGASPHDGGVNASLWLMNSNADYTVARISCFRDEALANTYEYCIHSNSGYRWKDFGGVHWVSPAHREVQDQLIEQVVDLARLGFDEILLDHCGYPQDGTGEMTWIKRGEVYDLEHLDVVIGGFLERLHEALEQAGWGPVISIRTNAAVVEGNGDRTGLTGAVLEQYADRIWMSGEDLATPAADVLTQAGLTRVQERLVLLNGEVGEQACAYLNF